MTDLLFITPHSHGSVTLPALASITVGPIQFDTPVWLALIPIGWLLTLWIGRKTLSGLGTTTRRIALVVRLIVILLLAGAMAEPQWRKESKDVAVTVVLDASRSIPQAWQKDLERYVEESRATDLKNRPNDELGVVTVGADAYVQSLPSKLTSKVEKQYVGGDLGTNLAGGLRLAMAVKREDAANRVVLMSDGNETAGSLLATAEAAKAMSLPIDVLPVRYSVENEVMMEQLVAPGTARMGETLNLKVVLSATKPGRGRLHVLLNGDPVPLGDKPGETGAEITLAKGTNVFPIEVPVARAGPQQFRAVFEPELGPDGRPTDTTLENNEQLAVTFVTSEGKVLVVIRAGEADASEAAAPLVNALTQSKISAEVVTSDQIPKSLTELNAYDAILMVDQAAYDYSQQTQEDLRQYIHETGGGLLMVGGPNSFGAGGWIGSPLEDALPIKLDPPQKRQMPRGALVIVSHSIEMPDGVSWGKKTATAAVDALSRLDLAGIVEFDPRKSSGISVVHPLSEIGDGSAIHRAINNLAFGDMMDYGGVLQKSLEMLAQAEAGAKHVIMITDGDAQPPSPRLIQQFKKERITISTVGVYPHGMGDLQKLKWISDQTGGQHYEVINQGGLGQIVQIFIKEAQTVKRSLIWEGDPFVPAMTGAPVETMRGITGVPPLSGYVVAGEREGLALVSLRGKESDPILAQWQYGLGRVVTFTSDAATRWDPAWVGWPGFKAFWEQHVRWAMRPSGSPNIRVTTEKVGDQTRVLVDALDSTGERLNFAKFKGRVAGPGGKGQDLDLQQVGPGRYEGRFDSKDAGTFVVSMRYAAPRPGGEANAAPPDGKGDIIEGSVQAAVTRPFADEFRALTDNMPLLQRVASMTGGKVLDADPTKEDLWRRDGLHMPVAITPIWLYFALTGIGMFLMDVAVRRVRIDIPAMARALGRSLETRKERHGQQMGALQQAREKAKQAMAARGSAGHVAQGAKAPGEPVSPAAAAATAKVKFEAPADRLRKSAPDPVAVGGPEAAAKKPDAKPQPGVTKEEGLSRLMQAKKRAREGMEDE
jgi:uncharacterized membrane protein